MATYTYNMYIQIKHLTQKYDNQKYERIRQKYQNLISQF